MIKMLPLVDALRSTSHLASRRKELEEAGYDDRSGRAVDNIHRYAERVSSALDAVEHHHSIMKKELQGSRSFMATSDYRELDNLVKSLGKHIQKMEFELNNI